MELYQLDYVLHEPCEDQGWFYMAEIPALPGCQAWAETASETLIELSAVGGAVSPAGPTGADGAALHAYTGPISKPADAWIPPPGRRVGIDYSRRCADGSGPS